MKKRLLVALSCAFATVMALCLVGCSEPEPPQELQVVETGFIESEYGGTDFAVIVENPNEDVTAEYPTVTVTGYDADGNILFSQDSLINFVYPGEKAYFIGSDQASGVDHIDVTTSVPDESWINVSDEEKYKFEVTDLNPQTSEFGDMTFSGSVTNNSGKDVGGVRVNILVRDEAGELLTGYYTYAENVPDGQSRTFTAYSLGKVPGYASAEGYAELGYE